MSHESDILTFLAAAPNRVFHRSDICGELIHISPACIDTALSKLVRKQEILKPKTAYFQHKPEDGQTVTPVKQPWEDTTATKTARIVALLKARGPVMHARHIQKACPDIHPMSSVLSDMGRGGHVHSQGDGFWALGLNPRAPKGPTPVVNRWGMRRPDELRPSSTEIPSEASETREAETSATSEVPPEARAPESVADVPDESAVSETPAPEIGPALAEPYTATITAWDCRPAIPSAQHLARVLREMSLEEFYQRMHEEPPMQEDTAVSNDTTTPPGTLPAPVATFHMEMPGLRIAISGEAKAVMEAVSAIEQTIGAQ